MKPESFRTSEGIDWQRARDLVSQSLARSGELEETSERTRAILESRARSLAKVHERALLASESLQLATFLMRDERYAIETRYVRKIGRLNHFTPVPGAPALLLGVFNSGGEILPLFDLAGLFGVGQGRAPLEQRLIVLGETSEEFGVLVDSADEVVVLRLEHVLSSASAPEMSRPLIRGITEDALVVIDGEQLLNDSRLRIDQEH